MWRSYQYCGNSRHDLISEKGTYTIFNFGNKMIEAEYQDGVHLGILGKFHGGRTIFDSVGRDTFKTVRESKQACMNDIKKKPIRKRVEKYWFGRKHFTIMSGKAHSLYAKHTQSVRGGMRAK